MSAAGHVVIVEASGTVGVDGLLGMSAGRGLGSDWWGVDVCCLWSGGGVIGLCWLSAGSKPKPGRKEVVAARIGW